MTASKTALIWSALVPLIIAQQQVLGQPRRLTLDDIVPSTDPHSSQVKCCPQGTQFDGISCSLGVPSCTDPDTYYQDGACISKFPPRCSKGRWDGQTCVSTKEPTCDPPYVRSGSVCITADGPSCGEGFELHETLCFSTTQPSCDVGFPRDDVCVHPDRPQCPSGSHPVGATCVKDGDPECGKDQIYDATLRRCISTFEPFCPDGATAMGDECVAPVEPICELQETVLDPGTGLCTGLVDPQCEPTAHRVGDHCEEHSEPVCSDGSGWQLSTDPASGSARCCPVDMSWDGQSCVKIPDASGKCEDGTFLDHGLCRKPANPRGQCPSDAPLNTEGTKCVRTDKVQCDAGLVFDKDHNVCRSIEDPVCRPRQRYDTTLHKCVLDRVPKCVDSRTTLVDGQCVATSDPSCPHPFTWDGAGCINGETPKCSDPLATFDGTDCISPEKPQCADPSTIQINGQCVAQHKPVCPPKTTLAGDKCLVNRLPKCKEGKFSGSACVLDEEPVCSPKQKRSPVDGRCISTRPPICTDPDFEYRGGQCVSKDKQTCPTGFHEEGGECVSQSVPKCPDGSVRQGDDCLAGPPACANGVFDNGDCVTNTIPKCPPSETYKNGQCVAEVDPTCNAPAVYDKVLGACVDPKGVVCPVGQKPQNGKCVLASDEDCVEYEFCPAYTSATGLKGVP